MELVLPTAFVAFMMGISAFVVALVSLIFPRWLCRFSSGYFLSLLSCCPVLLPPRRITKIQDAIVAETEIPAGKEGRVLYEGILRARCDDHNLAIATKRFIW